MKNREIYVALALYAVLAAVVISLFNGIGDSGDSILHYLYSKYAFKHPIWFHGYEGFQRTRDGRHYIFYL